MHGTSIISISQRLSAQRSICHLKRFIFNNREIIKQEVIIFILLPLSWPSAGTWPVSHPSQHVDKLKILKNFTELQIVCASSTYNKIYENTGQPAECTVQSSEGGGLTDHVLTRCWLNGIFVNFIVCTTHTKNLCCPKMLQFFYFCDMLRRAADWRSSVVGLSEQ